MVVVEDYEDFEYLKYFVEDDSYCCETPYNVSGPENKPAPISYWVFRKRGSLIDFFIKFRMK